MTGCCTQWFPLHFPPAAGCNVHQLEKKLILGVTDSRSRLTDKFAHYGSGSRSREETAANTNGLTASKDLPWLLSACGACWGLQRGWFWTTACLGLLGAACRPCLYHVIGGAKPRGLGKQRVWVTCHLFILGHLFATGCPAWGTGFIPCNIPRAATCMCWMSGF